MSSIAISKDPILSTTDHPNNGLVSKLSAAADYLFCPYKTFTTLSDSSRIRKIIFSVEQIFMSSFVNLPLGVFAPRYSFPAKYMRAFGPDYERQLLEDLKKYTSNDHFNYDWENLKNKIIHALAAVIVSGIFLREIFNNGFSEKISLYIGLCSLTLEILLHSYLNKNIKLIEEKIKGLEKEIKRLEHENAKFPFKTKDEYIAFYNKLKEVAKKFNFEEKDIHFLDSSNVFQILGGTQGIFLGVSKPIIMIDPTKIKDLDELEGIVAHELSHIRKKHVLKSLTIVISYVAIFAFTPILVQYLTLIPLFIVVGKIQRIFEKQADLLAAKKVGAKGLIKTFERLIRENKINRRKTYSKDPYLKLWQKLKYTADGNNRFDFVHPNLTERVRYLREFEDKHKLIKK